MPYSLERWAAIHNAQGADVGGELVPCSRAPRPWWGGGQPVHQSAGIEAPTFRLLDKPLLPLKRTRVHFLGWSASFEQRRKLIWTLVRTKQANPGPPENVGLGSLAVYNLCWPTRAEVGQILIKHHFISCKIKQHEDKWVKSVKICPSQRGR